MKLSVPFATLALALAAFAQNGPSINTPVGVQQCAPALLMVSGGTPPYDINALPVGQPAAPPLETITTGLQGNSFTWKVNLQGGTSVTLQVRDSTGAINFSNEVDIQNSSDNSCLNSSAGGSTSTGGASPSPGGSSTSGGGPSTSGTSASTPSPPTPSSSPSSTVTAPSTAPPTPSTSAAGTPTGSSTGTTSSASSSSPGTGTNTAGAQQTSNAAVGLASGSTAGVVGALLAYVLA